MQKIKDWVWNALFLDFYLDKRWTFRFKLMNLISGDTLRPFLSSAWCDFDQSYNENEPPAIRRRCMNRAIRTVDKMWKYYRK